MSYQRARLALWWNVGLTVMIFVVLCASTGLVAALFGQNDAAIVLTMIGALIFYVAIVLGCVVGAWHLLRQAFGAEARQ